MISNCGSDERGQYNGGKAGDQTGGEWKVINWYRYSKGGWNFVARHPNKKVRDKLAEYGKSAAANDHVGYDMYQRTTYWSQLVASEYDPAKIKTDCESDCSCGIASNAKAIGYILNDEKLKKIPTSMVTSTARKVLKEAGFEILTDSKYLTSDLYLLPGDIIVNEGHHMVTNLDYGKNAVSTSEHVKEPVKPTTKSTDEIAKEVIAGKWGNGDDRKKRLTSAGYDYNTIQSRVNEMLKKPVAETPKTIAYKTKVNTSLNVRKGPGTSYPVVTTLPNGVKINVVSIENNWAKLDTGNYVSATYIVKV